MRVLYAFLACMWILMLGGGGIAVTVLGPISISGFGDLDGAVTSGAKAGVALTLIVAWVLVLSRMKNRIFSRRLYSGDA